MLGIELSVVTPPRTEDADETRFVREIERIFATRLATTEGTIALKQAEIEETNVRVESLRSKVEKSVFELKELGDLRITLTKLYTSMRTLHAERRASVAPSETQLRMQYREIVTIPRVMRVWIESEHVQILTDVLYGLDHDWRWRRIGPFIISFGVLLEDVKSFRWGNLEGPRNGVRANTTRLYHGPPNIEDDFHDRGKADCAGTAAHKFIRGARIDRDYPTLVQFAVRYPECRGTFDSKVIEAWPIVDPHDVPQWYIDTHAL